MVVIMEFIDFLNKNENSRKIFGKREIKIIEKQLQGISLTQSEKNRLSRDIRKKFEFIKNVLRFEKYFSLKKGILNQRIVEETKEVILNHRFSKKIKKILLFGSIVSNKMTFRSDIDIAVKFDKISLKDATKFRINVSGRLPKRVDVQVFNVLPEKLKKSILLKNKVIYENK